MDIDSPAVLCVRKVFGFQAYVLVGQKLLKLLPSYVHSVSS